jgi:hypothetical protein
VAVPLKNASELKYLKGQGSTSYRSEEFKGLQIEP